MNLDGEQRRSSARGLRESASSAAAEIPPAVRPLRAGQRQAGRETRRTQAGRQGRRRTSRRQSPGPRPSAARQRRGPEQRELRVRDCRDRADRDKKPAQPADRRDGARSRSRSTRRRARRPRAAAGDAAGICEPAALPGRRSCRESASASPTTRRAPVAPRRCSRPWCSTARSCPATWTASASAPAGAEARHRGAGAAADPVPGRRRARLVPGMLALYDAEGREVAFARRLPLRPRPRVLFFEVPETASTSWRSATRSTAARGLRLPRDRRRAAVRHQHLPARRRAVGPDRRVALTAGTSPAAAWRSTRPRRRRHPAGRAAAMRPLASNPVTLRRGRPARDAPRAEPNDTARARAAVDLPRHRQRPHRPPGDVDVFRFEGRAGEEVVAEVRPPAGLAARFAAAADGLPGSVVAWNDDSEDKEASSIATGLLTHQADSYVRAKLPADGVYYVRICRRAGPRRPSTPTGCASARRGRTSRCA